jgi:hypothetical protein
MLLCEKGHYFNADIYSTCPVCAQDAEDGSSGGADYQGTEIYNGTTIDPSGTTNPKTRSFPSGPGFADRSRPGASPPKDGTVVIFPKGNEAISQYVAANKFLPVVGWLVIITGPGAGRDFRLVPGPNTIGRDREMRVCLDFGADSDQTVSRRDHAVITYDIVDNVFFISDRTMSSNLPRLNGKGIRTTTNLKPADIIQVGDTRLMFVPLCGNSFQWGGGAD